MICAAFADSEARSCRVNVIDLASIEIMNSIPVWSADLLMRWSTGKVLG